MKAGRLHLALWAAALPLLLAGLFLYRPRVHQGPALCAMPLLLGVPCPGCGITRALAHATHGEFADAFRHHALWPLLLAGLAAVWWHRWLELRRGAPPRWPLRPLAWGGAALLAGFWVLRILQ